MHACRKATKCAAVLLSCVSALLSMPVCVTLCTIVSDITDYPVPSSGCCNVLVLLGACRKAATESVG